MSNNRIFLQILIKLLQIRLSYIIYLRILSKFRFILQNQNLLLKSFKTVGIFLDNSKKYVKY